MPFDAASGPIARTHLDLRAENGGHAPWCGPAAIALVTGLAYAEACRLLHAVCPERYPEPDGVVAAWWRDLVEALRRHGLAGAPLEIEAGRPCLLGLAGRRLEPGWYLVRVTDHFLLLHLRQRGRGRRGLAVVHDNTHTAVPLSPRVFGLRRVTHALRLADGHALDRLGPIAA